MGRWKMGPNGGYWDAADSGPDQYQPTPQEQAQVAGAPAAGQLPQGSGLPMPAPVTADGPGTGGLTGDGLMQWPAKGPIDLMPDGNGGWGYGQGGTKQWGNMAELLAALKAWGIPAGGINKPGHENPMPGAAVPLQTALGAKPQSPAPSTHSTPIAQTAGSLGAFGAAAPSALRSMFGILR
jgi:hypothetical protein